MKATLNCNAPFTSTLNWFRACQPASRPFRPPPATSRTGRPGTNSSGQHRMNASGRLTADHPAVFWANVAEFRNSLTVTGRWVMVWSSTPWALGALFVAGLVIRLWLAPRGGHPGDLLVFQRWEGQLANQGWSNFHGTTEFH